MLPVTNRLSSRDINRLFARPQTQKIISYPFVYFVGTHPRLQSTKWWIQLSTKISKSSVKRHILKRIFYDCIAVTSKNSGDRKNGENTAKKKWLAQQWSFNASNIHYTILAVPQKARIEEMTQVLATGKKNTIVPVIKKQFVTSLSSFTKKLWSFAESKKQ